jgi:Domain of unknown function (DUF4292)
MTGRFTLFLALLAVAGCSTSRPTFKAPELPPGFPHHNRRFIAKAVHAATKPFEAIQTESRMRVETRDERRSVNLDIKYRRSDSLLVNARVIFGIEAVRSLVTPDSFYVYDRLNKKLYRGPVDEAYRLLPIPVSFNELFASIAGAVDVDQRVDWQVTHDSSYYYLTTDDMTRSVTVDPRLWRVVQSEARAPSGDLIERRTFSDFDSFGGYVVPRRIEVDRPADGERFQVYHRSVRVNPEPLSFHFEVGRIDEDILVDDDH